MAYKLGSLFDGSGGFPLAGSLCGIEPVWAAEVEPYPIAVTRSRFPSMEHLGDISKINGGEIEPVDIITFGSPCQDLSVAGKRAGLKHEANGDDETTRSGLFMEAVRIIKEMREATNGEYPSFALWENVPGAFSSNKGEDFRVVCEELIKIVEPSAVMPEVPENGWTYADSYVGNGWSLAYRVFDAQYWGVPQRRRRIHLVVDFRGERAREILFEREGVRGYFAKGGTPWQGIAADAQDCAGADDRAGASAGDGGDGRLAAVGSMRQLSGVETQQEISPTILAAAGESGNNKPCVAYTLNVRSGVPVDSAGKAGGIGYQDEIAPTLRAGVTPAVVFDARGNGDGEIVSTLTGDHENRITDYTSAVCEPVIYDGANVTSPINASNPQPGDPRHTLSTDSRNYLVESKPVYCLQGNGIDRADTAGCNGKGWKEDTSYTLNTIDRPAVVYALDRASFNQGQNAKYDFEITDSGINSTLVARGPSAVAYEENAYALTTGSYMQVTKEVSPTLMARDWKDPACVAVRYIVRRLTPTECARLQGFADRWGDIDEKDSLTPEEFAFWHEVRNTHAAINGKKVQEYTESQMLTWYNRLHTDAAEYKMWGNGIALPPALYVLQGMVDAFERDAEDDWLQ